jgi:hypothetical protein
VELPIFNDNLKSSATWTARLASELELYREWQVGRTAAAPISQAQSADNDGDRLAEALALVTRWAAEPEARFDRERLLELNRLLRGVDGAAQLFRVAPPILLSELHDPAPASMLPRLLDLAFDWFTTEGFAELHPLEQATLVYLRLLDLSPFEGENDLTVLLAAGFYTRRGGFPALMAPLSAPLFAPEEKEEPRYRQALEAAFRMLTQPLVEYFADGLIRTMQREREEAL